MTRQCVESILNYTKEPFEFVFVDNGSTDGTLEYLSTIPNSKLIANTENRGFAAGNNQGMLAASGEYIMLLNNDTIVTEEWLSGLHYWLKENPSIGIVGPRANNVAPIQNVYGTTYNTNEEMQIFAKLWREKHRGQGFYPHRLIGFCMLFHRQLLEEVGGLDESFYPGGYEDDDFSIRTRIRGKMLWVAHDVYIHHVGHGTFEVNGSRYKDSSLANAERFRQKWNPGISAFELITYGYNPSVIVQRDSIFLPDRHFVPLGNQ